MLLSVFALTFAALLPASTFADPTTPLNETLTSRELSSGATIQELSFAGSSGAHRIHAKVVSPQRPDGSAVLFVHWLGDPKTTNLSEFLPDALALAGRGTTSLMIDAPWSTPQWFEKGRSPASDYADSIADVKDLRRSLDVLTALPGVAANRIAYVGHDFGAMYGALLSAVDARPRFYVFMAGTTTLSEWFLLGAKPPDVASYVAAMAPLDPVASLPAGHAAGYFLQFADKDDYISSEKAKAFLAATPDPKVVTFYRADHALAVPEAARDRVAWLSARLAAPVPAQ